MPGSSQAEGLHQLLGRLIWGSVSGHLLGTLIKAHFHGHHNGPPQSRWCCVVSWVQDSNIAFIIWACVVKEWPMEAGSVAVVGGLEVDSL